MVFTLNHGWGKVKEVIRSYLNASFFLHFLHPWKLVWRACYDQCIMVRQRTTRYPFVHPSALFLCTFFACFTLAVFSCCNFSRVASCCSRFMSHIFASCCTYFVFEFIRVALFHMAVFSSSLFSCCTLFMLHLFVCCTALALSCTFFILHSFQVSLFLCGTLFVLHFSKIID